MASVTAIVNAALTLLGESRIMSIDENIKAAREAKALYDITRDALLAKYNWSFAKARTKLIALVGAPPSEYALRYQIPPDSLRLLMVGEHYVGVDLTDYRGSPVEEFSIEGREILTNMGAPLSIQYVKAIADTSLLGAAFVEAFSCRLAELLAEPLTQSDTKRDRASQAYRYAMSDAIRANAIEMPPQKLADDEWVMSRL